LGKGYVDVAPEHLQRGFNTFYLAHEAPEPLAQDEDVTDRSYNRMGWINGIPALGRNGKLTAQI
jgi:hypothetical protein